MYCNYGVCIIIWQNQVQVTPAFNSLIAIFGILDNLVEKPLCSSSTVCMAGLNPYCRTHKAVYSCTWRLVLSVWLSQHHQSVITHVSQSVTKPKVCQEVDRRWHMSICARVAGRVSDLCPQVRFLGGLHLFTVLKGLEVLYELSGDVQR